MARQARASFLSGWSSIYKSMLTSFLRNTFGHWLQCEAEARGAALKLLDDTISVPLLVLISSRILVLHAEAHRAVEEDGELARRGGHGLGLADPASQATVERAEGSLGAADVDGHEAQLRRKAAGALAGAGGEHLATADLAPRRQTEPRGEVLLGGPLAEVGAALSHQR